MAKEIVEESVDQLALARAHKETGNVAEALAVAEAYLIEVGARHSVDDIALIDQIMELLKELRGNETEQHGATMTDTVEAKPPSNPGGPAEINQNPNDENDENAGWSALCPKCKKVQPIVEAKELMVGKRKGMQGTCKECKGKVSWFPEPTKESTRYVSECVNLREAKLDSEAKTVEVTVIHPGWSANDRYYDPNVLKESVDLFVNCKAYADHPGRSSEVDRPERSVRDIVGYYPKVWLDEFGAIKAQLKVLGEAVEWLWPLIEETVRTGVDLVSTSINALGKVTEGEVAGRKGAIVNKIVKANSADVVTTAAAGGKFERILASDREMTGDLLAAMDYDEWVQSRPDFATRLKEELKTARKDEADAALAKELTETKKIITDSEAKLVEVKLQLDNVTAEYSKTKTDLTAELDGYKAGVDAKIQEAIEAKDVEIAKLRENIVAGETAHRADKLLWEAKLPEGVDVRERIVGKTDEEAKTIIEAARADYRKLVLKEGTVSVRGNGPEKKPLANEVSSILGVGIEVLPGERPEQYAVRKRMLETRGGR